MLSYMLLLLYLTIFSVSAQERLTLRISDIDIQFASVVDVDRGPQPPQLESFGMVYEISEYDLRVQEVQFDQAADRRREFVCSA